MNRILSEVSAADMRGPLDKLHELLADEKLGPYWLNQLVLMMRKEPTHILIDKWLQALSNKHTWESAEAHFLKTKKLWYNEPEWPFQICILEIGGMNTEQLLKKWWGRYQFHSPEDKMAEEIKDLGLLLSSQKRKILLIRLQTRFLNLPSDARFSEVNHAHPKFNLSYCPPETAFFMRPLVEKYFDSKPTVFAMNFTPPTMVDDNKKRVFYFAPERGYGNGLYMGAWDIHKNNQSETNSHWIFQYNLK